jgi:hypothetical protein
LEQLGVEERLNPEKLMQDLKASGNDAAYLPDVDAIVAHIGKPRKAATSFVFSATAVSAGFTGTCWNGWAARYARSWPHTALLSVTIIQDCRLPSS